MVTVSEDLRSLRDLAHEMNAAMVKAGRASWRRQFNAKLWACNRDRALALIAEYRERLASLSGPGTLDDMVVEKFSRM